MDARTVSGLIGAIGGLILLFFATGVPIPMYSIWQNQLGMTNSELSLVSMFYLLGTLIPLLFFPRISDHVGRRPAVVMIVLLGMAGAGWFMHVDSGTDVMMGRLIQGIVSGFGSSTVAAYVVDLSSDLPRWVGPAVTSSAPNIGIIGGALSSGAAVTYGGASVETFMTAVVVLLAVIVVFVLFARETMPRSPGLIRSFVPKITMPENCLKIYSACAILFVGTWAIEGFSQSFSASVVRDSLGHEDVFLSSVVVVSILVTNVAGCFIANRFDTRRALRASMALAAVSVLMMYVSLVEGSLPMYIFFNLTAGLGEGIGFAAGVTALIVRATKAQRAGTYSLIYATGYGGSGFANLIVGLVPGEWSVADFLSWYVVMMFAMLAVLLVLTIKEFPAPPVREVGAERSLSRFLVLRDEFQDVPGLAVQGLAYGLQRGESDALDLAGLDLREVDVGYPHVLRELLQVHLAVGHDAVQAEDDRHGITGTRPIPSGGRCRIRRAG